MKAFIDRMVNEGKATLKTEIDALPQPPALTIVSAGEHEPSKIYVRNKKRLLDELGIEFEELKFGTTEFDKQALSLTAEETRNPIFYQLPLPDGFTAPDLPASLDVDAFGTEALSNLLQDSADVLPCTVQAILDIIDTYYGTKLRTGIRVAVLGRSYIVGRPLSIELINRSYAVTSLNSKCDLSLVDWDQFDVVVSATGQHGVIKASQFSKQHLVIDVGICRIDGKVVGDVLHDEPSIADITPVPHGVGRLTVLNVARNTVKLAKLSQATKDHQK